MNLNVMSLKNWSKNSQLIAQEDRFKTIRETFERTTKAAFILFYLFIYLYIY